MKTAAIYLRVSTEEQTKGHSLDTQRERVKAFAAREGYLTVEEYADDGISAKTAAKRPGFQRMVRDAMDGKFEAVLAYKFDRLFRNTEDHAVYTNRLAKKGVRFISATEPSDDSTSGKLIRDILAAVSEADNLMRGERIAAAKKHQAQRGCHVGNTPFGYKRVAPGQLEVYEPEAEVVRETYRRFLTGHSLGKIARDFNAEFPFRNWYGPSMRMLMLRVTYKGRIQCRDEVYPGNHEALVDEATWDAAATILYGNKPAQGRPPKRLVFGSLVRCQECGRRLGTRTFLNRTGETSRYLHVYYCKGQVAGLCGFRLMGGIRFEQRILAALAALKPDDLVKEVVHRKAPRKRNGELGRERVMQLVFKGLVTTEQAEKFLKEQAAGPDGEEKEPDTKAIIRVRGQAVAAILDESLALPLRRHAAKQVIERIELRGKERPYRPFIVLRPRDEA